jgi:hypothetical protein
MRRGKPRTNHRKVVFVGSVAAVCYLALSPEGQRFFGLLADLMARAFGLAL